MAGSGLDRHSVHARPQVLGQVLGRLVPLGRILSQALQTDRFQAGRDVADDLARRDWLLGVDLVQRFHRARAEERRLARQHLIQNRAERIDVGGRAHGVGLALGLFRGHVAGGADHFAADRVALAGPVQHLGQAEIGDLGHEPAEVPVVGLLVGLGGKVQKRLAAVQQDVGRLQVAVDDPTLMGEVHGPGQ